MLIKKTCISRINRVNAGYFVVSDRVTHNQFLLTLHVHVYVIHGYTYNLHRHETMNGWVIYKRQRWTQITYTFAHTVTHLKYYSKNLRIPNLLKLRDYNCYYEGLPTRLQFTILSRYNSVDIELILFYQNKGITRNLSEVGEILYN